ncbi:MAG: 50S ribosomal protein L24 [Flavobacterium sp.]|nr:MAG: 50S ribosomal protein L24 [Flavobacterium sp.]
MRRINNQIPKLHIKKDDTVKVLSGDDKGKTGRVIEVFPHERKAIVDGINMITRHSKVSAQNPEGGRIRKPAAIFVSKLIVVDPKKNIPTRVGRKLNTDNKLVRYSKKSQEEI